MMTVATNAMIHAAFDMLSSARRGGKPQPELAAQIALTGRRRPDVESPILFRDVGAADAEDPGGAARSRSYQKRGAGARKVVFDEANIVLEPGRDVIALDDALTDLAKADERKSNVVEMRFFGGLNRIYSSLTTFRLG